MSAVSGGEGGHDTVFMVGQDGLCQGDSSLQMPAPRWGHTSAFIKSRLILCGGSLGEASSVTPDASCDIYCLERRSWSKGAAMATPRGTMRPAWRCWATISRSTTVARSNLRNSSLARL